VTFSIDNALKIPGWMEPHDLEWLANKASQHRRIVEVGCWAGRSTTVLAENTDGVVFAVDTWMGSEEHQHNFEGKHQDWIYDIFLENMRPYIKELKVMPVRMPSVDAARILNGERFDMVFIDASHDYESVHADILAWKPLCTRLLCGHDMGHPPIVQATQELLPGVRQEHSMWVYEI
jgi:hypothetical protein